MNLIYFSPLPWCSFTQRPHQFVQWFHQRFGGDVLWIEPYPTRLPYLKDLSRINLSGNKQVNIVRAGKVNPRWIRVIRPNSIPVEPLPLINIINHFLWATSLKKIKEFIDEKDCSIAIGKPSKLAVKVIEQYPEVNSFFDIMDDFPEFYRGVSRFEMRKTESKIVSLASKFFVSSTELFDKFNGFKSKVFFAPNACSLDNLPPVAAGNMNNSIVLGYVGTIGEWFDWDLIKKIAEVNLSYKIKLIGPVYNPPTTTLPSNVHLLPACSHDQAIKLMSQFTVGLIPFKSCNLTASVDPIKYYEYRSLGKPVISAVFGEMKHRSNLDGVFLIDNHTALADIVNRAINYRDNIKDIQSFRLSNSWESRFDAQEIFS